MERPFQAYEGGDPYVFVCYAHDDKALVYPEITRLKEAGFNIWYDEGIKPGSEWSDTLANHIKGCAAFLYFVTPRSVVSEYCRREVSYALEQPCGVLAVHLEPTELPSGLQLTLSNRQAILKHDEPPTVYAAKLASAIHDAEHHDVEEPGTSTLVLGDWTLDVATQRLMRGENSHELDPKALSVLLHLIDGAPKVVNRQALIERTWPDSMGDENMLDHAISQLRRALGDDAEHPQYIETLPNRGYRLIANLEPPALVAVGLRDGVPVRIARRDVPSPRRWWIATVAVAVIVIVIVVSVAIGYDRTPVVRGPDLSIAVLPLSEIGDDPETTTLATAMTEELRTAITSYSDLQSISAPDVASPRDVADASYVVGGNVQRLGERVRLRVSLTRTTNAEAVWSETFDRRWAEVRADPAEIARTAGRFVRMQLYTDQGCEQVRRLTRIEEAVTALCAAIAESTRLGQVGDGDSRVVLSNARQAAALDPNIPLSYGLIASSYLDLAVMGRMDWQDATRKAQAALDVGRASVPNDPGLLEVQARVQQLALNYAAAQATYERLLTDALHANTASIHVNLAALEMARGNVAAALDHYRRAQRIVDFLGPWYEAYAGALLADSQHRAAIEIADAGLPLLETGTGRYFLWVIKGLALTALGEAEDAEGAFEQAIAAVDPTWKAAAAVPLALLGRTDEARVLLARQQATKNPPVLHIVHGYAALNSPQAFEWIHEAIDRHVMAVVLFLRVNPIYAELRRDPHWNEVMAHLEAEEVKGASGNN